MADEDLQAILANPINTLLYHVADGLFAAEDMTDGMVISTLLGSPLYVSVDDTTGEVRLNNALVTDPDLFGSNGVIHGIDAIISADFVPEGTTDPESMVPATPDTPTPAPVTATPAPIASPPDTPAPVEESSPDESGSSVPYYNCRTSILVGIYSMATMMIAFMAV